MDEETRTSFGDDVMRMVEQISPLLAGKPPADQGAALCVLTAVWLCGFRDLEDPESEALQRQRAGALEGWCKVVRAIVKATSTARLNGTKD